MLEGFAALQLPAEAFNNDSGGGGFGLYVGLEVALGADWQLLTRIPR